MGRSFISGYDLYLFKEGRHYDLYRILGSHLKHDGVYFSVWAPNAQSVSVVGDFNGWDSMMNPMIKRGDYSGIWEIFVEKVSEGDMYKFSIVDINGHVQERLDPMARRCEAPPKTASIVYRGSFSWDDGDWMESRAKKMSLDGPWSIYEVHIGSWMRRDDGAFLSYKEVAPLLADHLEKLSFSAVEFLPLMEHPFYGSWGYQILGYFAPTARYGSPDDLKYLINYLHSRGIAVIFDWGPAHFPSDSHGLSFFDGTALYEHSDPRQGFHPQWNSSIFNYGRYEVRSFLVSSAKYWLREYHIDGIRVDGVASMLYLDYGREEGDWIPNEFGGRENLDAVDFLRELNREIHRSFPEVLTIAEESTSWPGVTAPVHLGGLGFSMKWNMGWMHDTLDYFAKDPIHRSYHHDRLTFGLLYAFSENFLLPFSHDEVVYGKRSLINKMPGDDWRKKANLRLLFVYLYSQPGKKLIFMGDELGQGSEWDHESQISWELLQYEDHRGFLRLLGDLNHLYMTIPAMHHDFDRSGFEWIDCSDNQQSLLSIIRANGDSIVVFILNFTPVPRYDYRVGVPSGGRWKEILNSDSSYYSGTGVGNFGEVEAQEVECHGRRWSLSLTLPPLGGICLMPKEDQDD